MGRIQRGHVLALMPCMAFSPQLHPALVPTPPIRLFNMTKSFEEQRMVNIAVPGRV